MEDDELEDTDDGEGEADNFVRSIGSEGINLPFPFCCAGIVIPAAAAAWILRPVYAGVSDKAIKEIRVRTRPGLSVPPAVDFDRVSEVDRY